MFARLRWIGLTLLIAASGRAEVTYQDWEQAPHSYFQKTPHDRFTKFKARLESGTAGLDRSSERACLLSLLGLLEIPVSSQMLVFSTTSLQLSRIGPSTPRALYFSDDISLGFVPGGRIEIVALDSELGGVFYIFDLPRGSGLLTVERSTRCMNCHAGEDTGYVPGLSIRSVLPGEEGGSLNSFRSGLSGHGIPLADRFGGWYITDAIGFTNHWGNRIGAQREGRQIWIPALATERVNFQKYATSGSALLPQLVHEHQVGLVNRVVEAHYRARTHFFTDKTGITLEHQKELEEQAKGLVRYLLFTDEVPLPQGVSFRDDTFKTDFAKSRRVVEGFSLRDFDLETRLFRFRCSYMIYSPVFSGLPPVMKSLVLAKLSAALKEGGTDPESAHLPPSEKRVIRKILRMTLDGWPSEE